LLNRPIMSTDILFMRPEDIFSCPQLRDKNSDPKVFLKLLNALERPWNIGRDVMSRSAGGI
jgi:hypothetical protein